MEFLGPDELAALPVDHLTGYAYHMTEHAKAVETEKRQVNLATSNWTRRIVNWRVSFSIVTC